jgi:NAD(P)-dependent dehydrogenase (short-subunit alcohol dehydrogenase family)/acyl carrier protein
VLRAMGVSQVLHSRTLDFADALREGGQGTVDLVLNSLNKEFIPAGLSTLAPGGRFVELGKVGAWSAAQVRAVRPDVAYHHFDLSEVDPAVMQRVNREILADVAAALADGSLAPVSTQTYALDELDEAFGLLARGGNTGKLVIDFRPPAAAPLPALQAGALQVVTGGFGGLGREVAAALAAAGARHLLLAGRQVPDGATRQALAQALSATAGADVTLHAVAADVGTPEGVAALRAAAGATGRPLGWVVHAAGVLDDAPLAALDDTRLARVLAPKVTGGWLLHRWTAEAAAAGDPAAWIGFSSVAATFGPPGQGNYAAANAVLDAIAGWRGAHGLPARSLAWGPFAEAGMAARLTEAQARAVQDRGLRFLRPAQGMRLMLALARADGPLLPDGHALLGEVDWARLAASLAPNPLYALRVREAPAAAAPAVAVDLAALAALPAGERALQVNALLRERIARALYLDGADDIAPDAPFNELGLDSLVGVELVNALEAMFHVSLPGSIIFDAPSVALLTQAVLDRLTLSGTPAP